MTVPEILANVKYRNWQFLAMPVYMEATIDTKITKVTTGYYIKANASTLDVETNEEVSLTGRSEVLPNEHDEALTIEVVYDLIAKLERHERQEHFVYNGERIFNPHELNTKTVST